MGGLQHLLNLLREQQLIAPAPPATATTPTEQLLAAYDQYLGRTHGAAVNTCRRYLYFARQFLRFAFASGPLAWTELRAETITAFVTQATSARQGAGRKQPASATRIFLRYLLTQGFIPNGLEAAIPRVRTWKHATLPEHLSPSEVAHILTACADGTALGKRNYALLLLLLASPDNKHVLTIDLQGAKAGDYPLAIQYGYFCPSSRKGKSLAVADIV